MGSFFLRVLPRRESRCLCAVFFDSRNVTGNTFVAPSRLLDTMVRQLLRPHSQWLSSGMTEIRDGLWIGDIAAAAMVLSSKDHHGFTHVLSLAPSSILSSLCRPIAKSHNRSDVSADSAISISFEVAKQGSFLVRMVVPLNDTPDQSLINILRPCIDFIDEARKQGGKILVHCVAGVSRSAAVLTAYLMKTEGLSSKAALSSLQEKHKRASPNSGFFEQLQSLENMRFFVSQDQTEETDGDSNFVESFEPSDES